MSDYLDKKTSEFIKIPARVKLSFLNIFKEIVNKNNEDVILETEDENLKDLDSEVPELEIISEEDLTSSGEKEDLENDYLTKISELEAQLLEAKEENNKFKDEVSQILKTNFELRNEVNKYKVLLNSVPRSVFEIISSKIAEDTKY